MAYWQIGCLNVADLGKKFGLDRLLRHIAHLSIKLEKMVFDWENERQYNIDDSTPPEGRGFFGIYDLEGFTLLNATSLNGMFSC